MFIYMLLFQLAIGQHVNFTSCYKKVQLLNASDPDFCEQWDITQQFRIHEDIKALTLGGCRANCGEGYQLWPAHETIWRFFLFIFPVLLLASSVASATRFSNKCWSLVHLFGGPIDFIWSTIIRQEIARRNYSIALEFAPGVAQDVAAIISAYDLWWQNAVDHFIKGIKKRIDEAGQDKIFPQARRLNHLNDAEMFAIRKAAFALCDNR
jgi:hypothetical protein